MGKAILAVIVTLIVGYLGMPKFFDLICLTIRVA